MNTENESQAISYNPQGKCMETGDGVTQQSFLLLSLNQANRLISFLTVYSLDGEQQPNMPVSAGHYEYGSS